MIDPKNEISNCNFFSNSFSYSPNASLSPYRAKTPPQRYPIVASMRKNTTATREPERAKSEAESTLLVAEFAFGKELTGSAMAALIMSEVASTNSFA